MTTKSRKVLVVGELRETPLRRFGRVQRRANRINKGRRQPRGVFRFASYEDLEKWRTTHRTG